jgi:hypothetical protein
VWSIADTLLHALAACTTGPSWYAVAWTELYRELDRELDRELNRELDRELYYLSVCPALHLPHVTHISFQSFALSFSEQNDFTIVQHSIQNTWRSTCCRRASAFRIAAVQAPKVLRLVIKVFRFGASEYTFVSPMA